MFFGRTFIGLFFLFWSKDALKSVRVRMKHLVYSVVLLREVGLSTCEWLAYTPLSFRRFIYPLFTFDWQVYTSPPSPPSMFTCCELLSLPAVLSLSSGSLASGESEAGAGDVLVLWRGAGCGWPGAPDASAHTPHGHAVSLAPGSQVRQLQRGDTQQRSLPLRRRLLLVVRPFLVIGVFCTVNQESH